MPSEAPHSPTARLRQMADELTSRLERGEPARIEECLVHHPDLSTDPSAIFFLIRAELLARRRLGEEPSRESYVDRFPDLSRELGAFWADQEPTGENYPAEKRTFERTTLGPDQPAQAEKNRPPTVPGMTMIEKIGQGGMGVVWYAFDTRLGQPRAIKFVGMFPLGSSQIERIQTEAKAVARLDHPGVVRLYSVGECDFGLQLCMEYLPGGDLAQSLARGPMTPRNAADLVRKLALAVQHAHDHRVLHRDLKPANVLLTANGDPKITDFGLAKLLDTDDDLTITGAVMGTPSYMSPEQAEGRLRDITERTDIWSLGAILYECLSGRPPFKGDGRQDTLEQVKRRQPVPLRDLQEEIPADLEAICLRCLEKNPDNRYPTAVALASDLQHWLDGKKVTQPRKHRGVRWATLGLAMAVIILGATTLSPVTNPPVKPEPPPTPTWKAGQWNPLLVENPQRVIWPDDKKMGDFTYDSKECSLDARCTDVGMLALGKTDSPRFKFAITIQQNPWAGNIGLFFGFQEAEVDGIPEKRYLLLEFTVNRRENVREYRFDLLQVFSRSQAGAPFLWRHRAIQSELFPLPKAEMQIEVSLTPEGVDSFKVDGNPINGLHFSGLTQPLPAKALAGQFGVFLHNGNAKFRNAKLYLPENEQ